MSNIPIIGRDKSWRDLTFRYGALMAQVEGEDEPQVVGWQFGIFATRSDDYPFAAQFTLDPAKMTKDPIATVFEVVNQAVIVLESFRTCACIPDHTCLLHDKVPKLRN